MTPMYALSSTDSPSDTIQPHPAPYRDWRIVFKGDVAALKLMVKPLPDGRRDYKLNSYDLAVDIELADALNHLVFEHPEVRCVVLTGGLEEQRVFSAGANIGMLARSTHVDTVCSSFSTEMTS